MKLSVGYIIYGLTLLQGIPDSEANRHYHFSHWIKTSKTRGTGVYVFDWRLRLSVNQCMKVCQVTKACQFFNYETRPHLCGLIRTDELARVEVEQKPGYVYGNKSEWIQNDINRCDKCNSTGKCISNDLTDKKNNVCENSGCEEPRNVDFQGNMFSTGSNIKSKCKDGFHKLPVGLTIDHQTCAENGTWRPTYPCFKTNQYGESYYYVNHVVMTWFKAKEYCESYGGHLADISSKEEQTFMETMLSSDSMTRNHVFWIGGNDLDQEGVWRWSDSSLMEYSKWSKNNPSNNNGEEHCLRVGKMLNNFAWNDVQCFAPESSICEFQ